MDLLKALQQTMMPGNRIPRVGSWDELKQYPMPVDCEGVFIDRDPNKAGHANTLLKMFNSTQRPEDISEAEYATLIKGIMDKYTDAMTKVENMKKVYWS